MSVKRILPAILTLLLAAGLFHGGMMNQQTIEAGQKVSLPDPAAEGKMSLEEAVFNRRSTRTFRDEDLTLEHISQLLWAAQGITEQRRRFRTVPSAGATYPLEVFLVAGRINKLEPGVFRYVPGNHSLQKITEGDRRHDLYTRSLHQTAVRDAPAAIVIGAVFQRTTGRYGSRGERYVYMEAGHAGQNIHLQAESLGLGTVVIGAFDDSGVQKVLNLPGEVVPLSIMPLGY